MHAPLAPAHRVRLLHSRRKGPCLAHFGLGVEEFVYVDSVLQQDIDDTESLSNLIAVHKRQDEAQIVQNVSFCGTAPFPGLRTRRHEVVADGTELKEALSHCTARLTCHHRAASHDNDEFLRVFWRPTADCYESWEAFDCRHSFSSTSCQRSPLVQTLQDSKYSTAAK